MRSLLQIARSSRLPVAAAIAVGLVAALAAPASASQYGNASPIFDGLAMLRVAQGYNLTKAYDLTFPATSDEACEIAGVSAQTFVSKDHSQWSGGVGYEVMRDSLTEALEVTGGGHAAPCYWLHSDSAADFFTGLSRVWEATLGPNFKQLRKALRQRKCKAITQRMDRYPAIDLPANRIHSKVKAAAGGRCNKG